MFSEIKLVLFKERKTTIHFYGEEDLAGLSVFVKFNDSENILKINLPVVGPEKIIGLENPWVLESDWSETIQKQMINNLSSASKMRDKHDSYYVSKPNEFYSIASHPFKSFSGFEMYPSILEKSAILMYLIIKDHPFFDGNKRTGLLTCLSFLNICGFDLLKINSEKLVQEVEELIVSIAKSKSENKEEILSKIKKFILEKVSINFEFQDWMLGRYLNNDFK